MNEQPTEQELPKFTMADFLTTQPPGSRARIADLHTRYDDRGYGVFRPDLVMHCDSDACRGPRIFFSRDWAAPFKGTDINHTFLHYKCRNCLTSRKVFALAGIPDNSTDSGVLLKIGEAPSFGPPIPSRVISLVGPDREAFLRGYRCENQSLGIGAFSYYRRVVENQWKRIVGEVVRVAERINAPSDTIASLKRAAEETQFSKAIDSTKDALPPVLLINGQNPLKLLHGPLSEGLHDRTDEDCLALAQAVRVVLTELADRVSTALKDEAELRSAVSRLASSNTKKATGGNSTQ